MFYQPANFPSNKLFTILNARVCYKLPQDEKITQENVNISIILSSTPRRFKDNTRPLIEIEIVRSIHKRRVLFEFRGEKRKSKEIGKGRLLKGLFNNRETRLLQNYLPSSSERKVGVVVG